MAELPTRYDARAAEAHWYPEWEKAGLFKPGDDTSKPSFTVTIPPPNITGSLHMGHALNYSIHDLFGRFWRLRGKNVLILPGQDHAGIATQSVVDKNLRKQGQSAAQLGREAFIEKVWEWRQESGDTILSQLRALGCAFDWDRGRFTLDEAYVNAVLKVFIDWYQRGLIYRGKRVVNWDVALKTSVSDIETERKLVKGKLYHIRYPFEDGSGHVVIATTRPETLLADTAVAVHPSDERYQGKTGKTLILPLLERRIPLLADIYPDPAFGTGAVKITPAHDANDFEVGQRHGLEQLVLITPDGKLTDVAGPYLGLDRHEARKRVLADLEAQDYLEKVEDYEIPIILSTRSGEVIEPLLSEQWFVKQTVLAGPAIEKVKDGTLTFTPERYTKVYLDWMENIRDWCISRQLWWGHRIPVYYDEAGTPYAALSWDEAQALAGDNKIVRQDDDVLDTWFSSGLWPFATLGWPQDSEDMKRFYPTDLLITARDIIYLWVARMIMMSLDQLETIPFHKVMIYATVLTKDGQRMSKSLGTGVDPMTIIENAGADALRYTLLSQAGENQEIRYSDTRVDDSRHFQTKIWNATRFVLLNVHDTPQPCQPEALQEVDRWLLSRLSTLEADVRTAYEGYDCQAACQALYRFFWNDLCDWYIEVSKARLNDPAEQAVPQWVLVTAIHAFLVMLHPVMPFLTEDLYQHLPLPNKLPLLMQETWPVFPAWFHAPQEEARVERSFELTRAIRSLRAEIEVAPSLQLEEIYYEGDLMGADPVLQTMGRVKKLLSGKPQGSKFLTATVASVDIHLPIEGLIDMEKERARLDKDDKKAREELGKLMERLDNPQYAERAKPELVERDRALAAELQSKLAKLEVRRSLLKS